MPGNAMSTLTKTDTEQAQQGADLASSPTVLMPRPASPGSSPSPRCVEIPVRVRGLQAGAPADGSTDSADSFNEETQTLILFPRGAVVRLAAPVSAGQEVMLTNLSSQQQVHCKVISVRGSESSKGYVELEFTHRTIEFWGSAATSPMTATATGAPTNSRAIAQAEPRATGLKAAFGAALEPPFDTMAQSTPALAPVKPARTQHPPMTPAHPTDAARAASVNLESSARSAPDGDASAPSVEPKFDVTSAKNRIAGDLQTGSKWILTGSCIAALALALAGGLFFLHSRPASLAGERSNSAPLAAEASVNASVSPQVIEVKADAEPSSSPADTRADEAAKSPAMLSAPSPAAATPAVETKTGGMREAFRNAEAKLHLSIGNSKMTNPTTAPTFAASRSDEPPAVSADDASGIAPGSPENGIANGIISSGSPAIPAPTPVATTGGQATLPRALSTVKPDYPVAAKSAHIEGDVTIQAEIDVTGKVIGMKVVSGPALLQNAALSALQQWKYEPAKLDGQPVAGRMVVTLKFRLQ